VFCCCFKLKLIKLPNLFLFNIFTFIRHNKNFPTVTKLSPTVTLNDEKQKYKALLKGDRTIIRSIYDENLGKLASWTSKNNGTSHDARDILHEALTSMIIAGNKKTVNPPENLNAYIFSICKYKWYNALKKRNSFVEVTSDDQYTDVSGPSVQDEYIELEHERIKHKVLDRTFMKLSELCQKLLNLVKEGYSGNDIAAQLNMTGRATVNRRKFACTDAWKKYLKEDPDYNLIKNT